MIARIWHGKTNLENFESYTEFLKRKAIPDYEDTPGFQKLIFLRNISSQEGHFTLITFWEDMASIRNFTGEHIERAKYYPEDDQYLLSFEEYVTHYEVFAEVKK
jgi:heme-degrading monooxygenase HmoA